MRGFILGTAQLYSDYGLIKSSKKKISESNLILKFANENHFDYIDTARIYENSEKIIGNFCKSNLNDFKVITKIKPFPNKDLSFNEKVSHIKKSIDTSINLIGEKFCYGLLIHNINDFKNFQDEYLKILLDYKKNLVFKKIGISIYYPEELVFLEENEFSICQLPINLLDKRWFNILSQNKIKFKNKLMYGRSVFLQGLLLNFNYNWPIIDLEMKSNIKRNLSMFVEYLNFDNHMQFLLSYAISNPCINNLTLGVNSLENLQECYNNYLNVKKISESTIKKILKKLPDVDHRLLNPSLWN